MKQPGSNFVSWAGLALLAALILAAAYFDAGVLQAFLVLVLILCLIAFAWGRGSLQKIEVETEDEDCRGFPGQALEIRCRLRNRKLLPLIWLDLGFPLGQKTCIAPLEDDLPADDSAEPAKTRELRSAFLWLMPHQTISWTQTATAVHRGICRMDAVNLYSGDGFGLSTQSGSAPLACPVNFVVYPKIIPVEVSPILNNMSEMESARNGFYTDRTLLENTRDYREGDSFKNINWRLLARRDELQVNVYEKLTMRRVCFLPDMYSFTDPEEVSDGTETQMVRRTDTERMEAMFSLMASLIVRLHEHGVLCSLVIPAYGENAPRLMIPETAETQVMELLGALAEIDYDAQEISVPVDRIALERHKLGQIYVLSRSLADSVLNTDLGAAEELGTISILQEAPAGTAGGGRRIFTETDFMPV